MSKISIFCILVATLASFVRHTDNKISEKEPFKPAFDSMKWRPSSEKLLIYRELASPESIEAINPNPRPPDSGISFSAADGSRPLFAALQGMDLKNSQRQISEPKKRLPSIYIDKYFK